MTFINKNEIATASNLKESKDYTYDSTSRVVTVNSSDLDRVVSIYNETVDKTLYFLGDETRTGTIKGNEIKYNNVVSGVSDNDVLYILYKEKELNLGVEALQLINKQLSKLNKSINKIRE